MAEEANSSNGKVVQVIGPTLDVRFPEGQLPDLLTALIVDDPEQDIHLVAEVAAHLGNDVVRCIAMSSTDGLTRGVSVVNTGAPITVPVGETTLGRIFNLLGEPIDGQDKEVDRSKMYPIHRPAPDLVDLDPEKQLF